MIYSGEQRNKSTPWLAAAACLLWSTAFVGVKYGLRFAQPLGFAGFRFMLSGLLILPFCIKSMSQLRRAEFWRLAALVGLFQTFLLYSFFYIGMTLIPGALGAIIVGSSPLFAALTAHIMIHNDKMTRSRMISIGIGILGIILISVSRQPWTHTGLHEFAGILLLVAGCIFSALGNVIVSKNRQSWNPPLLTAVQIFLGGLMLTLISLGVEGLPKWPHTLRFYAAFGWLALLSAAAFSIWFILLKRPGVKVSELNVWKFIIPVFGAVLSWIILPDETPDGMSLIGMACVAFAVIQYNKPAAFLKNRSVG